MGLYSRYIFPRLCHAALTGRAVTRHRRRALAGLAGEVLEIGIGSGLNLACYPPEVDALHAVEPNPGMRQLAAEHLEEASFSVRILPGRAEELPFEEARFDAVVSTFTLCSIPRVEVALEEIRRVLKPGGVFSFLEHGKSPDSGVARWQRWLNPVQRRVADGCRLDRRIDALVADAGLVVESCENSYLSGTPRVMGYLYQGRARRPPEAESGARRGSG